MNNEIIERLNKIEALLLKEKNMMNADEAAMFLSIKKSTLYHLCSNKEISYCKQGKASFFLRSDLEEYLKRGRIPSRYENKRKAISHLNKLGI